ncbi:quinone-dependent dihydroorotate dehydrogenase [Rhodopirellula sp. JC740]|uniref:Dihydroorotate dehydrogenase (quinone) n=1 Tax=Rhodopirellula halodulae TaxID=2894198 RepID=A0ABS8NG08_9BACT|nr:quinone-dependent dihydroorotate dehydrogenase [Rhodopirellula sp. JC740]MCC9642475.1 quinone-dependent dihydroorotate dehydrogenase [Rhodopirellula sp. JC740]
MSFYKTLVRPLLFQLNAETAHHFAVEGCRWASVVPGIIHVTRLCLESHDPVLGTEVAGLRFRHPIGLAAGWDKSGRALRMLDAMGLGAIEIGSVSARSSQGNPKPRLFRLPEEHAVIVNYGLPNEGADAVASRVASYRGRVPIGINIVKTNDGPHAPACDADEILSDYERSARLLHSHADYLMLNLSCPNAKGGRSFFAEPGNIERLLQRLQPMQLQVPVFLKLAPHDEPAQLDSLLMQCDRFEFVRGFCFNLPSTKPKMSVAPESLVDKPGAVAGRPVASLINGCIAELYRRMDRERYAIIGAGGVFTAQDAYDKIRLGASFVQIYTAMIYEGPAITKRICLGLAELLKRDGHSSVTQAVGSAHE